MLRRFPSAVGTGWPIGFASPAGSPRRCLVAWVDVGQIVTRQGKPRREDDPAAHRSISFQLHLSVVKLENLGGDGERLARLDELRVFHVVGLLQHHDAVGEVLADAHQPRPRLGQRLEHQHARHHGKVRKMVGQILLGHRQRLHRRDAHARLQLDDAINQRESHGIFGRMIGLGNVRLRGKKSSSLV